MSARSQLGVLVRRVLSWVGSHEGAVLLAILLAAGSAWFFVELAEEVVEGDTHRFDRAVLLALRDPTDIAVPRGPRWLTEFARDITALGSAGVLTLVTLGAAGFLAVKQNRRAAVYVLVAVGTGALACGFMKWAFARSRPDVLPPDPTMTSSFPSGHSMLSAVAYLTLGAVIARAEAETPRRAYVLLCATVAAVLVGVSRVFLAVHWPTDVLAGWAAGAAWALLAWVVARWLERRGEIEPPELATPSHQLHFHDDTRTPGAGTSR